MQQSVPQPQLTPEDAAKRHKGNVRIALILGAIALLVSLYPFIYFPTLFEAIVNAGGLTK